MAALLRTTIIRTPTIFTRIVSVTVARYMGDYSTRHGNDPEVLQRNKESLLRKHANGSTEYPHWHEELATDAEAFIKSQRDEIATTSAEIPKLKESIKKRLNPKTNKNQ